MVGRCLLERGEHDAALHELTQGAELARLSHCHLIEMLLYRDLATLVPGQEQEPDRFRRVGAAVAELTGERGELSALLGAKIDAAAAEAVFARSCESG